MTKNEDSRLASLLLVAALAAASCAVRAAEPAAPLRTSGEAAALSDAAFAAARPFAINAQVVSTYPNGLLFVQDRDGFFEIAFPHPCGLRPGETADFRGHTRHRTGTSGVRDLVGESATITGTQPLPAPRRTRVGDLLRNPGQTDFVTVRGTITDAITDDIDTEWDYMILKDGTDIMPVAIADAGDFRRRMPRLVDAEVEISGAFFAGHAGFRLFIGPFIRLWSESCITVVKPPPADPFLLPPVGDLLGMSPQRIAELGRRTATGRVLCAWDKNNVLLKTDGGHLMRVELAAASGIPACGERASVVGYPETDLYRINLTRAQIRREDAPPPPEETPLDVTPAEIMYDQEGRPLAKPTYHGRLVRIRGIVRSILDEAGTQKTILIKCGTLLVPVDVTRNPQIAKGLEIGSTVEVTGICILDTPNWRQSLIFPHIDRLLLVPRHDGDLKEVARSPWWTAGRLLVVIGALFAALAAILVWNLALRHIARRSARALYRAEISKAAAELRIDERTRLAAELHDSVAQNLTGISMQISAANAARQFSPADEEAHLTAAEGLLRASLTELRRCIWDLRNDALDAPDFATALEETVRPVVGRSTLHVTCDLIRARLNDSTAHAILQIVRELAANAARHGGAANIHIACGHTAGAIHITVRDDGCGFDTDACAGPDTGHFGLKGIRERVKRLGGEFHLASTAGRGTEATIELRLQPQEGGSRA